MRPNKRYGSSDIRRNGERGETFDAFHCTLRAISASLGFGFLKGITNRKKSGMSRRNGETKRRMCDPKQEKGRHWIARVTTTNL